jgi:hypothetical protein
MTVLNSQRRNAAGFRVTREHALAAQVFQLIEERKHRIEAVSGVYRAMLGASTQATSGVAINSLVEQGSTVLAEPNDNFRYARRLVGQQLLALVKYDMLGKQASVVVKQGNKQKTVYFNREVMTDSGPVIANDIETAQVRVVLEDIPATPSFRAQQLQALSQMVQAAPQAYQAVMYPAMLELSDVPNRHELADQLRKVGNVNSATPEQEAQQAQQVQQQTAIQQWMIQLEMAQKAAEIKKTEAEARNLRGLQDGENQSQVVQLQQKIQALEAQLADKSAELDLRARELDMEHGKIEIDAKLKTEEIAMAHIEQARNNT